MKTRNEYVLRKHCDDSSWVSALAWPLPTVRLKKGLFKCCFTKILKRSDERTCLPGKGVARCSTQSGQGFLPTLRKLLHLVGDLAGRAAMEKAHLAPTSHRSWGGPRNGGHHRAGSESLQRWAPGRPADTLPRPVSSGGGGLRGGWGLRTVPTWWPRGAQPL